MTGIIINNNVQTNLECALEADTFAVDDFETARKAVHGWHGPVGEGCVRVVVVSRIRLVCECERSARKFLGQAAGSLTNEGRFGRAHAVTHDHHHAVNGVALCQREAEEHGGKSERTQHRGKRGDLGPSSFIPNPISQSIMDSRAATPGHGTEPIVCHASCTVDLVRTRQNANLPAKTRPNGLFSITHPA